MEEWIMIRWINGLLDDGWMDGRTEQTDDG